MVGGGTKRPLGSDLPQFSETTVGLSHFDVGKGMTNRVAQADLPNVVKKRGLMVKDGTLAGQGVSGNTDSFVVANLD